jgi:PleD family two-component response regulator
MKKGTGRRLNVQNENFTGLLPENGTEILSRGKESILLVEDEDLVREMCVTILSQLEYTVFETTNGKDAGYQQISRYD